MPTIPRQRITSRDSKFASEHFEELRAMGTALGPNGFTFERTENGLQVNGWERFVKAIQELREKEEAEVRKKQVAREEKRRAALPKMKHLQPSWRGFKYRTPDQPISDEERKAGVGVIHSAVTAKFISIELSYLKLKWEARGEITFRIEYNFTEGNGFSYSVSGNTGDSVERHLDVCKLPRLDHKVLTHLALLLDPFIPEIIAKFEQDKDGAVEFVKSKLPQLQAEVRA